MDLNIQLFGGRGASSSAKVTNKESVIGKTALKSYFSRKGISDRLKDIAIKSGNKDIISDGVSIYQLNKTGLNYSKDESLIKNMKGFENSLKEFNKQAKDFKSIDDYISDKEYYDVDKEYSFDTKLIKKAKKILGKDAQASVVYEEWGSIKNPIRQPRLVIKNKKGEKGFMLPMRKF